MGKLPEMVGPRHRVVLVAALLGLLGRSVAAKPMVLRVGTHGPTSEVSMGCDDCHSLHAAPGGWSASDGQGTDWSCLDCHGSRRRSAVSSEGRQGRLVASLTAHDIEAEFRKPSSHPLSAGDGQALRRPSRAVSFPRVAADLLDGGRTEGTACTDCHDPHAKSGPTAPESSGLLGGRALLDARGRSIDEQDFCYRCHGSGPGEDSGRTNGESIETLLLPHNPSVHPVAAPAMGLGLPGLLAGPGAGTRLSCSDCHGNEDEAGPRGPHGSQHAPLLKARYNQEDGRSESPSEYALCYSCHDRNTLLSDLSGFALHASHVVDARAACSACHDAHGSVEYDHLLDFASDVVTANSDGRLDFDEGRGPGGTCSLTCHGKDHAESPY